MSGTAAQTSTLTTFLGLLAKKLVNFGRRLKRPYFVPGPEPHRVVSRPKVTTGCWGGG